MQFKNAVTVWLDEKKYYIKESTYFYYYFEMNHYWIPILGDMQLTEISEKYIQEIVLRWQIHGADNLPTLKKSTIQNLVILLKQFLKFAERKKWIPSVNIEIHFANQNIVRQQNVFSQFDQKKIIKAVLSDLNAKSFGILLALNSGLRIGELCALTWSDIDIQQGILRVRKTLQRVYYSEKGYNKTKIIITTPKTSTSIRDIPLGKQMLTIIDNLNTNNPKNYVLTSSEQPLEPRAYRNYYKKFLARNEITNLHFHSLRHTFATQCIESGADYKCVSEMLGHSTINMTMNMYVHPLMETKRKCVEMIMEDH